MAIMLTPFSSPATAEEEAYRFLLNGIRMGQFKAGDRLVPEEIASQLGMSRMPVREAFRRLATQELLTIRPNRGAVVRGLNHQEAIEVFEMRAVLEGLAATAALDRIGPADLDELERRLDAMDRCAEDLSAWVTEHRDFHLYLCGLSARPRLVAQIAALHVCIEPHMRLWLQSTYKPRPSREEHGFIIDALRRKRPELIEAVVREHVSSTLVTLAKLMRT
ncbi:GntR family transcriptional regulator [Acidovorax sp. Root219]|uniref:GntR family transcriptional regulator n=1 Tax=Acidovorax sp. Root219 TaxID=1736493 RepID=UPI00070B81CE|nr:GntR family transcriptional regulator [Acidovorax sp. Root219]